MGLYVDAVPAGDNSGKIDSLIVSAAPRTVNLLPVSSVESPVEGAKVADGVAAPVLDRSDVVDFPAVVGRPVAMRRE